MSKTQVAQLRYLRMAPRKVRLVADLIKGLPVSHAEAILLMQSRRASGALLKLLRSAVANAKNNQKLNPEKLAVESVAVNGAGMLKRYLPRARGSATPIQKKMSHVVLVLKELDQAPGARYTILPKQRKKKEERKTERAVRKEKEIKEGEKVGEPRFFKRIFKRKAV